MTFKRLFRPWIWLIAGICFAASSHGLEFDHSHALFDNVLKQFVNGSLVNYTELKANPSELDAYLDQIASVSREDFQKWSENQQMAFLINLYNAAALRLVIDHYPVKSIRDIGGLATGPWDRRVIRLFGKKSSLGEVEHKMLRSDFDEPAIHFALVCAARGCPELRGEPYIAERLNQQFIDQGRRFLAAPKKNSVDVRNRIVYLSPIFKWYKADFVKKSGSVLEFVQFYLAPELSDELSEAEFRIKYTQYDWSLNDSNPKKDEGAGVRRGRGRF